MHRRTLLFAAVLSDAHALWSQPRTLSPRLARTSTGEGRRQFFGDLLGVGVAASTLATLPSSAQAATVIDIQRYGDKELKIGAINKVKQLLRNELLQRPAQAGDWVRLALTDALSFSAKADAGGPDAAVQFDAAVLKANPGLGAAVATLQGINKQVLKTTECTLADIVAYAGAEAIEAAGGPRIQVQIGRYDGSSVDRAGQAHFSWTGPDQPAELAAAFQGAGFTAKDRAVLLGAVASVERAAADAKAGRAVKRVDPMDEDDELFPMDGGIFIPQTFGSQKAMFGELLSTLPFDTSVFGAALKGEGGAAGALLVGDDATKAAAAKYAGGKVDAYRKDLVDAYTKLTIAGARLTGAKVLAP